MLHTLLPLKLVEGAGHRLHNDNPCVSPNEPAGHGLHSCNPLNGAYVPAGHGSQASVRPLILLYVPLAQYVYASLVSQYPPA